MNKSRHEAGGVPTAGDQAAEGTALGRLGICMHCLWIKPLGEGDYLIWLDGDSSEAVYVAFNIILEISIGDRTRKCHSGILCLNSAAVC
jgi:hypothetical protein